MRLLDVSLGENQLLSQECTLGDELHLRRGQPQAAIDSLVSGLGKAEEPQATFRSSWHDVPTTRADLELMLANVYVQQDRTDDARNVLDEAVRIRAEHLEADHIQTALARLRLGEFLIAQSDYTAAEQPLLIAHKKLLPYSEVVDPLRRRAATKLLELYQTTNQADEAAEWQAKVDTLNPSSEENETP